MVPIGHTHIPFVNVEFAGQTQDVLLLLAIKGFLQDVQFIPSAETCGLPLASLGQIEQLPFCKTVPTGHLHVIPSFSNVEFTGQIQDVLLLLAIKGFLQDIQFILSAVICGLPLESLGHVEQLFQLDIHIPHLLMLQAVDNHILIDYYH